MYRLKYVSRTKIRIISIILIALAIPLTVFLAQFVQELRSRASGNSQMDKIAVRQTPTGGEFYDMVTGQKFIPRGNNYIRLAKFLDPYNGCITSHSTFNVTAQNDCQTLSYDAAKADQALSQMHQGGYNVVRVFINERLIGQQGGGLSSQYLANVADFMTKAKANGIYVDLTLPYLPLRGGYLPAANATFESYNGYFLSTAGVEGKKKYLTDFISGLRASGAPMDDIFSYSIENELFFQKNYKPLNLVSGAVTTANGQTYDISSAQSKQQMMDEGLTYYINQTTGAIKSADPNTLVGIGFFSPTALGASDPRTTNPAPAFKDTSQADFVDVHIYLRNKTLSDYLNPMGISGTKKPLLMGEFGAWKDIYPALDPAISSLKDLQKQTCQYNFSGWLLWTWDTSEQTDAQGNTRLWTAQDENGKIANALSPNSIPNICPVSPTPSPSVSPTPTPTLTPSPTDTPTPTPTPTMTTTPTPTPRPSPTDSPTPTPSVPPTEFALNFTLGLDGIGATGDNTNRSVNFGTVNPRNEFKTLQAKVCLYQNGQNDSSFCDSPKLMDIVYNSSSQLYEGRLVLNDITAGNYSIKIDVDKYLVRKIGLDFNHPTWTIAQGNNEIGSFATHSNLIVGDISTPQDNHLNSVDWTIINDCLYFNQGHQCSDSARADLNADGRVDETDINYFLREASSGD